MKATEYTVLVAPVLYELIEQVNAKIKEGWQPTGGITMNVTHSIISLMQPMVKIEG